MNQQEFAKALKYFEQAAQADPKFEEAKLNQGIALLNLQKTEQAIPFLQLTIKRDPKNARAWYNLGLLYKNSGDAKSAVDAFQHTVEAAPNDADSHYFLGLTLSQSGENEKAVKEFEQAIKLNQFHASAEFGIATAYRRLGNQEQAKQHLVRFQHLTQTKIGAPITLAYGDQGPLSLVSMVAGKENEVEPPIPVRFTNAGAEAGLAQSAPAAPKSQMDENAGRGACFLDYDNDGQPDLFLTAGSAQGGAVVYRNVGNGHFDDMTKDSGLDTFNEVITCAAADYDSDGFVDLAIATTTGVQLLHNEHNGAFKDVTATVGFAAKSDSIRGLTWIDYDHDGDVDLYVIGGTAKNQMWRNNGNATFSDVTADLGFSGDGNSYHTVGSDVNNDRAVDMVVSGDPIQLFKNPREGKWNPEKLPFSSVGLAVVDYNKDGWMDWAVAEPNGTVALIRNDGGRNFAPVELPNPGWRHAWGITAIDYDNDGWIDLAAVGETKDGKFEVRLFRNEGSKGFRDVTNEVGLDKVELKGSRGILAVDYDTDGDADLLVIQNSAPAVLLRNDGGNRNNSLRIELKGLNDNKTGIGTKIEIFAGMLSQKFEITGAGYLGQSAADLVVGLGKNKQVDVVRMLWPTGVVQDEIEVALGKPANIMEIDRRGSSCPILFAWDGTHYRFISDMIGAGVVGHWVGQNERNIPDPTEYLKVDGSIVKQRNGLLSFRFMEPMEEVVYIDQLRLLAVDHPAEYNVEPNEYFAANPPYPEFKVISSNVRDLRLPAGAWDDNGRNVLSELTRRDRVYVNDFKLLHAYAGYAEPHNLTLDLGEPYEGGTLRLLLHGFIEYFTATSMFSAHQAGIDPVAPYLEAEVDGKWVKVVDDMGFPAGLPRTTVADLTGKLPRGTRRIRIGTNLQIYWDQVLIDRTQTSPELKPHEVPMASARLAFHGYPLDRERGKNVPGDHYYTYEVVSPSGPYVRQAGAYTRTGDVLSLIKNSDDRFAVFGSGDVIKLDFDASKLPALPKGWTRDYFFFADGFEKDMDFYAADGLTVDPLPFHSMGTYPYPASKTYWRDAQHVDTVLDMNTRFYGEIPPKDFRYHYPKTSASRTPKQD
jgi:Flp pilus assembly protein TadD